jgi:hypothetical protein
MQCHYHNDYVFGGCVSAVQLTQRLLLLSVCAWCVCQLLPQPHLFAATHVCPQATRMTLDTMSSRVDDVKAQALNASSRIDQVG